MNGTTENIDFKKKELKEDELLLMTEEYPYYSIAQFRLLCGYKKNNNKNFEKQALVTALFFSNTRWLNKQLNYQTKIENEYDENGEINNSTAISSQQAEHPIDEIGSDQTKEVNEKKLPPTERTGESAGNVSDAFEPLYTVDYFASQGIKVSEESINNDKLSTQLKSFTEWLKSMKKIHTHLPEGDEQTEKIIQHIAESSNVNTNVVTEAMAEVLVKQDKIEQAIEMYEKLSLNYPAKSAYFAMKIKSLKSL